MACLDVALQVTLHATAPVYIGVDRMPLTLSPIQLSHVSASHTRFLKDVLANIIADTILASPAMLGSLEVCCVALVMPLHSLPCHRAALCVQWS